MRADIAIAGASFAGTSLAYHLRDSGLDVLLVDRKKIGEGRTSTCGMPTALAEEMVPGSSLQSIRDVRIKSMRAESAVELAEEYCVIDYRKFCTGLFRKSRARFMDAEVQGAADGKLQTSEGPVEADFIVDCTGWRRILARDNRPPRIFSGLEITAPVDKRYMDSMNFFIDRRLIRGYAWIFPIGGGKAHVGLGGMANGSALNACFMKFLKEIDVEFTRDGFVGGGIPCIGLGKPVENGMFFLGDSARQVLPLTAEGIKPAIRFSAACATAITEAAAGKMTKEEALHFYEKKVLRYSRRVGALALMQKAGLSMPQIFLDTAVMLGGVRPLQRLFMRAYFSIAK